MAPVETILLTLAAAAAALFTAWTIGAGSSGSTPFAPAVGANAIATMRAAFLVGILGFAGAVTQGAAVSETMGNELVAGVSLSAEAATVALVTAAALIAVGVFRGYPIATAFAVFGGVVGAGLAMGGRPAWGTYTEIALFWALTPFVGGGAAYGTARALRSDDVDEALLVPVLAGVVGIIVANMEFSFLGAAGEAASLAAVTAYRLTGPSTVWTLPAQVGTSLAVAGLLAAWMRRDTLADVAVAQRRFLLALGALVAFSAGGGKVGLAIGPLLPLLEEAPVHVPMFAILFFGGIGLLLGSWMAAPRMIKALAQDYSGLGPRRSIAVLIPSFAIAQVGIFYGLPMSFNEIFVSAIAGSGYAAGAAGVSRAKILYTILAWAGSLAAAFGISYGFLWAILRLVG